MKKKHTHDLFIIFIFITIIVSPFVGVVSGIRDIKMNEKRKYAHFPIFDFSIKTIQSFPKNFEEYFNDNFKFRNHLISFNAFFKKNILNTSPSSKVVTGKNKWLFRTRYLKATPFNPQELEQWKRHLHEKRSIFAKQGILYLLIMAPNKHSIYPEFIPDNFGYVKQRSITKQLSKHLEKDNHILDLTDVLLKAKHKFPELLYIRLDTHWNSLGAFIGQSAIMQKINSITPNDKYPMLTLKMFSLKKAFWHGNLVSMLGISRNNKGFQETIPILQQITKKCARVYTNNDYQKKPIGTHNKWDSKYRIFKRSICNKGKNKLLVIADSFSNYLAPFIGEIFQEVIYLDGMFAHHLCEDTLKYIKHAIMVEKPDIVIEVRLEEHLKYPHFNNI